MGRLGGAMNDKIERMRVEKSFKRDPVTDVQVMMREVLRDEAQPLEIPGGVALVAEEHGAHIVVDAVDLVPLPVKMLHGFRAY
jgi:hypothetical protein